MKIRDVKSAYIHIPFCMNICSYCDFCKMYYNENIVNEYLEALINEITVDYKNEELKTIYIGGGTPSSLSCSQLRVLLNGLNKLKKERKYEYTIECNFDSITKEKIDLFIEYGINRISFGLESTNHQKLEFLNRVIDVKHVKEIIAYCKEKKLENINIDLIYATKAETLDILKDDLDFIFSLDVPHISTYSLIIEENTKLYIDNIRNISEELDDEMYQLICNSCREKGYYHYEISNFCKPGYESRHNLVYWNNNEYYGFGLGAASYIGDIRKNNTRSISKYLKGKYCQDLEKLSIRDKIIYEVVLNLRLNRGINKNRFFSKYKKKIHNLFNYRSLIEDGLISEDESDIYLEEEKFYVSNAIILKFLEGEIDERK